MPHSRDFLTVGSMGHASQIAAGIAFSMPHKKVLCIDGDGALLMHTGALAISADCNNLIHLIINLYANEIVLRKYRRICLLLNKIFVLSL